MFAIIEFRKTKDVRVSHVSPAGKQLNLKIAKVLISFYNFRFLAELASGAFGF